MSTGDTVNDERGRSWTLGEPLGRGLWATTWLARGDDGREVVAKIALGEKDLTGQAAADELLRASRDGVLEQAELLREAKRPMLPALEAQAKASDGRPVLLMPRYATSLARRLTTGTPLRENLVLLLRVLRGLEDGNHVHGNLHPGNILIDDRGEPVLTDPLTPAVFPVWCRLTQAVPDRERHHPPEAEGEPHPRWDTWGACVALYRAAMAMPPRGDARREEPEPLPEAGLDRFALAALRDRALARLKDEQANPRFLHRVTERLGALLNRGLSFEVEPSPPYRFQDVSVLLPRLQELVDYVDPQVESVGRVLLSSEAKDGTFHDGAPPTFSVGVTCTAAVSAQEDIGCGLQLLDLDAPDEGARRVPAGEIRYTVNRHPSGRLRFDFTLPEVSPGRYRAKVGFWVVDSGAEPAVATGEFEVRPPAGYVPPAEDLPPTPVALPLPTAPPAEPEAEKGPASDPSSHPGQDPSPGDVVPLPVSPAAPQEGQAPRESLPPTPAESTYPGQGPPAEHGPPPPASPPGKPAGTTPTLSPPELTPGEPPRASDPGSAPPWDDLPPSDGSHDYLPGDGGEDLSAWEDAPSRPAGNFDLRAWVEHALELARRDIYTTFLTALGAIFLLLLVAAVFARSCGA